MATSQPTGDENAAPRPPETPRPNDTPDLEDELRSIRATGEDTAGEENA